MRCKPIHQFLAVFINRPFVFAVEKRRIRETELLKYFCGYARKRLWDMLIVVLNEIRGCFFYKIRVVVIVFLYFYWSFHFHIVP